jgi:hypothetical protein
MLLAYCMWGAKVWMLLFFFFGNVYVQILVLSQGDPHTGAGDEIHFHKSAPELMKGFFVVDCIVQLTKFSYCICMQCIWIILEDLTVVCNLLF